MIDLLKIMSFVLSGTALISATSAWVSAIKDVRRRTGDNSSLTYLLSGEMFQR